MIEDMDKVVIDANAGDTITVKAVSLMQAPSEVFLLSLQGFRHCQRTTVAECPNVAWIYVPAADDSTGSE